MRIFSPFLKTSQIVSTTIDFAILVTQVLLTPLFKLNLVRLIKITHFVCIYSCWKNLSALSLIKTKKHEHMPNIFLTVGPYDFGPGKLDAKIEEACADVGPDAKPQIVRSFKRAAEECFKAQVNGGKEFSVFSYDCVLRYLGEDDAESEDED